MAMNLCQRTTNTMRMLDTQYDQDAILDDDLEDFVDLNADLFDANGGLTADAYAMLAEMDSAGAFI